METLPGTQMPYSNNRNKENNDLEQKTSNTVQRTTFVHEVDPLTGSDQLEQA